ncbi:IucA/IucC family protein [Luteipulveratus sp. YIM 133132]|uniref:IucA/IucC family protein n=1 Tax=Luteipulveratus flavus TaxID=3031728 RepID=UPI0023AEE4C3|nr:IucA/IucC family protein [Luteipulveratus sp. YIM 133132]MDE9364463.1 IucA/IucC family protein [Luteipulveratus sp. YIM 133132]
MTVTTEQDSYATHLTPRTMEGAQRALVGKIIAELAHERLVAPVADQDGHRLAVESGRVVYRFRARRHHLEHWAIDGRSIERTVDGVPTRLDAQELITELAPALGISDALLPTYLEEIASTLGAAAWKSEHGTRDVATLLDADYQQIESAMTEGHPAFVANNGRIGYGADDYAAYAPETGAPVRLVWLAARRAVTHLACGRGLDEQRLYAGELGEPALEAFHDRLRALGLDPADYVLVPVHPWQWVNKIAITFAPDLGRQDLVHLGVGEHVYQPQQSIRTFFNSAQPKRHYVKMSLSIQNMGFVRGLSPRYMRATPAINDWVGQLVDADPTLRECGFGILRERASVGYTGDAYHRLDRVSPHQKMVAALWRESPVDRIAPDERLATMASLLHRDGDGNALVSAMIRASGLPAPEWLRSYLRAYVRPVVHCLLRYELAYMPHGENLVMVVRDHVPVRMLMKDIGEEIAVMGDLPVPDEIARVRADVPQDVRALSLHTDVFDGFLRFLAAILDGDGVIAEDDFWAQVAACIREHEHDHPELAETARRYDLFRPTFRHSCLNRLQLRNTVQMVDLADQAESLIFAGELVNPIAAYVGQG